MKIRIFTFSRNALCKFGLVGKRGAVSPHANHINLYSKRLLHVFPGRKWVTFIFWWTGKYHFLVYLFWADFGFMGVIFKLLWVFRCHFVPSPDLWASFWKILFWFFVHKARTIAVSVLQGCYFFWDVFVFMLIHTFSFYQSFFGFHQIFGWSGIFVLCFDVRIHMSTHLPNSRQRLFLSLPWLGGIQYVVETYQS